jgi:branched-chain amino acid transport system permease protein
MNTLENKKQNLFLRLFKGNPLTILIAVAIYGVTAAMVYSGSAPRQFTNMIISVSCYIVMAVSLNLVVGFLGELSLGHAGFMSAGLFSGCLVSISLAEVLPMAVRMPVSMIIGGIVAAIVGFIVGLPALRLKGDYLAIVTLACGEIIKSVITNLKFTGGALGLNTSEVYSSAKELLPFAVILVFVTMLVVMNLKKSKQGRAIMAIRDNRIAAEAMGVNITKYKLTVFVIAAFFAGAAGVLYGHSLANIKPDTFDYNMSIEILVIVVLGGMGSIRGSIIAAIILRALPEMLRGLEDYRMLIYSVLLIIIMLLNASPKFAEFKGRWSVKNMGKAIGGLFNKNKKAEEAGKDE